MSKRSKYYKQLINKENYSLQQKPCKKQSTKTSHSNITYNTLKSIPEYCSRDTTPTHQSRYRSTKRQTASLNVSRRNRSDSKSRKDELLEWYNQVERQYEVAERYYDCQMLKLKVQSYRPPRNPRSRINEFKTKRTPMAVVLQQRNILQNIPIKISRQIEDVSIIKSDISRQKLDKLTIPLKQQISLQSELRLLKHQITIQNTKQIQQILLKSFNILPKQIKLSAQQFEPFAKTTQLSTQKLAQKISESISKVTKNWKNCLRKKFSLKQCQDFFRILDFQQKKYVDLKTFVRQSGILLKMNNIRKRDIFKIFMKISDAGVITLKSLSSQLSYQ